MNKKNKSITSKFTSNYWNKISKYEHYYKGTPLFNKLRLFEYLNFLKEIHLENFLILKTDLYVEAKNEGDNFLPYLENNHFVGMDISLEIVKMARENLASIFPAMKFVVSDI
jgi:hypothetical protein